MRSPKIRIQHQLRPRLRLLSLNWRILLKRCRKRTKKPVLRRSSRQWIKSRSKMKRKRRLRMYFAKVRLVL